MHPVEITADCGDGARSRGLAAPGIIPVKGLLALPHLLILSVLNWATGIVAWIGYRVVAFTGELPEFFYRFPERALAWQVRATGWVFQLTDDYPPFEWEPAAYPVELRIDEGPGPRSRGLAVLGILLPLKAIAILPHVLVVAFVALAAVIANWIILFTGTFPPGIFEFVRGMLRWSSRLSAWLYALTDEYAPFRMKA